MRCQCLDKVLRHAEQKTGIQNILQVTVGEKVFSSPSTSIHILDSRPYSFSKTTLAKPSFTNNIFVRVQTTAGQSSYSSSGWF